MLKIFNTLTREKEVFKPIHEGKVGMYVCGVTVYDLCHIGHGRTFVCFDVIARYLRSLGYDLTYVRNMQKKKQLPPLTEKAVAPL